MVRFHCLACGAKAKARAEFAGHTVKCPKCGLQQVVPGTVYMEPEEAQRIADDPGRHDAMPSPPTGQPNIGRPVHIDPPAELSSEPIQANLFGAAGVSGRSMPRRAPSKKSSDPPNAAKLIAGVGCSVMALFAILCCSGVLIDSGGEGSSGPRHASPRRGGIVHLATPGLPVVWISANSEVHEELTKLSLARDQVGVEQLMQADLVMVAFANTRARVIEPGFMTHRVRILEGKHAGRDGIVNVENAFAQPIK